MAAVARPAAQSSPAKAGRSASPPEIKALTSLRFFAALLVLLSHSFDIVALEFPAASRYQATATTGDVGVGTFFVLSGFILAYTYGAWFGEAVSRSDWWIFIRRRFARIWPLHVVTLVAAGVVIATVGRSADPSMRGLAWGELPLQFTLTHAWPPFHGARTWNPPSWSISGEWFAYLLCPFLLLLIMRLRTASAAALTTALLVSQFIIGHVLEIDSGITRIYGFFAIGAFLQIGLARHRVSLRAPDATVCVVVAALIPLIAVTAGDDLWRPERFSVMLLAGLLVAPLSQVRGFVHRLLISPRLLLMGRASFALYMTHGVSLRLARPVLTPLVSTPAALRVVALVATYVAILAIAVAVYRFFEHPAERYLRPAVREA